MTRPQARAFLAQLLAQDTAAPGMREIDHRLDLAEADGYEQSLAHVRGGAGVRVSCSGAGQFKARLTMYLDDREV